MNVDIYYKNELEEKELKYIGGIAKNRKVKLIKKGKILEEQRIDEIAKYLNKDEYEIVELKGKKLWVAKRKSRNRKIIWGENYRYRNECK